MSQLINLYLNRQKVCFWSERTYKERRPNIFAVVGTGTHPGLLANNNLPFTEKTKTKKEGRWVAIVDGGANSNDTKSVFYYLLMLVRRSPYPS
jgi:hypothetical protein